MFNPESSGNAGKLELPFKKTIECGPKGGRNLAVYEEILDFKKEELEGKIVLDLGSGEKNKFSKELEKAGVHATVVSLSPEYSDEKKQKLLKLKPEERKTIVAGMGEQLPFKDESFDEILALFSVSYWSDENYDKWLPEILRVLKPGGIGRIGPLRALRADMYDDDIYEGGDKRKKMKKFIKETGCKCRFIFAQSLRERPEVLIINKSV